MIFFTADLHLGHKNIIKHCNRPFSNVDEMNEAIINNWNKVVKDEDDVYVLGDFYWGKKVNMFPLINRLKGSKYLILGNHDHPEYIEELYNSSYFKSIKQYDEIIWNGLKVVLFHYPLESWNMSYHGSVHVYGHVHNSEWLRQDITNRFNVGVDVCNFCPVSIVDIFKKRKEPTWKIER